MLTFDSVLRTLVRPLGNLERGLVFPTQVGTPVNYANLNHRSFKLSRKRGFTLCVFPILFGSVLSLLLPHCCHSSCWSAHLQEQYELTIP
jgi:hypothetical protein